MLSFLLFPKSVHDPVRAAATTRMAAAARQAREARLTTLAEAAEVETAERQLREQRGAADFSVRRESGVWQDSSQVDPRLRFEGMSLSRQTTCYEMHGFVST